MQKPIAGTRARPECILIPHESRYSICGYANRTQAGGTRATLKNYGGLVRAAVWEKAMSKVIIKTPAKTGM